MLPITSCLIMDKRSNANYRVCDGTNKRTGKPCRARAVNGGSKCYHHGGASLRGAESPSFKTGKYVKHMPTSLLSIYQDIQDEPTYQDINEYIKITDTFIRSDLEKLDDAPDSAKTWKDLRGQVDNLIAAFNNEKYGDCHVAIMKIDKLIDDREAYHKAVAEIRTNLAEQRKNHTAIASIEYKGESVATASDMLTFVSIVLNLISSHVSNKSEQQIIYDAINTIIAPEIDNTPTTIRIAESVERT